MSFDYTRSQLHKRWLRKSFNWVNAEGDRETENRVACLFQDGVMRSHRKQHHKSCQEIEA